MTSPGSVTQFSWKKHIAEKHWIPSGHQLYITIKSPLNPTKSPSITMKNHSFWLVKSPWNPMISLWNHIFFGLNHPWNAPFCHGIWPPLVPLGASSGFLNWRTEHCLGPGTSAGSQRDLSGRGGLELVKGIHRGFSPIRCWESNSVFWGG